MGGAETQRFSWRRMAPLLGLVVVAVAIILAAALVGGGDDDPTPIGEQSCAELVTTLHELQDVSPDGSFDEQAQASRDGVALNERVDELGGCPNEPDLQ